MTLHTCAPTIFTRVNGGMSDTVMLAQMGNWGSHWCKQNFFAKLNHSFILVLVSLNYCSKTSINVLCFAIEVFDQQKDLFFDQPDRRSCWSTSGTSTSLLVQLYYKILEECQWNTFDGLNWLKSELKTNIAVERQYNRLKSEFKWK